MRPAFPVDASQFFLPLVLDQNIKVPAPINVFLREYQREGVRFFYDRYKEGRGGVLGDDMGLVRTSRNFLITAGILILNAPNRVKRYKLFHSWPLSWANIMTDEIRIDDESM